jgi:hypothetical protein
MGMGRACRLHRRLSNQTRILARKIELKIPLERVILM